MAARAWRGVTVCMAGLRVGPVRACTGRGAGAPSAPRNPAEYRGLRAASREGVEEAGEILDIEHGRGRGAVAVGVGLARGVGVEVAGEVLDVQDGERRGAIAVGVAGER